MDRYLVVYTHCLNIYPSIIEYHTLIRRLNGCSRERTKMAKVAVIGAGINGLSCALKIKERFKNTHVTVISEHFSPDTTGDGSGGLWYPYLCGDTPEHLLTKWGGETYKYLHKLWLSGGFDICFIPMHDLYTDESNFRRPNWINEVFGYQELSPKQLDYLNWLYSAKYRAGFSFLTFIVPPTSLLGNFSRRFQALGGEILQSQVTSLQDPILNGFQVVVNCSGVGAKYLVPDNEVFPIRGQVIRVNAPWLYQTIVDEDRDFYIIPNAETCVLGGTHQEHNYNKSIDNKDSDSILGGCQSIVPGLKHAKIVKHWTGLRPGRSQVRLEAELIGGKLYIHNYGHGGSGLTLFWGCASEVLQILEQHLQNNILKCKL